MQEWLGRLFIIILYWWEWEWVALLENQWQLAAESVIQSIGLMHKMHCSSTKEQLLCHNKKLYATICHNNKLYAIQCHNKKTGTQVIFLNSVVILNRKPTFIFLRTQLTADTSHVCEAVRGKLDLNPSFMYWFLFGHGINWILQLLG